MNPIVERCKTEMDYLFLAENTRKMGIPDEKYG